MLTTKLIALSVIAFTSLTQATPLFRNTLLSTPAAQLADTFNPETASWPKVNIPHEFQATARVFVWDQDSKQLQDQKQFGVIKMSASLNHQWFSEGIINADGSNSTTQIDVLNHNSQRDIFYKALPKKSCGSEEFSDDSTVESIIDKTFDPTVQKNLQYGGVESPEWDLTTKYNRLNSITPSGSIGESYYYTVDTGSLRYEVSYDDKIAVKNFGAGFIPKTLTIRNDFIIQECVQRLFLE
eukprot:403331066